MKIKYVGVIFTMLLLTTGCAREEKKAYAKMKVTYDKLIGLTEEEVILEIGAPDSIVKTGDITIFKYKKSFGMSYDVGFYSYTSHEKYDRTNVLFKNGRVFSWEGESKR